MKKEKRVFIFLKDQKMCVNDEYDLAWHVSPDWCEHPDYNERPEELVCTKSVKITITREWISDQ